MSQNPDIPHSDSPKSTNQGSDTIEEKKVRVLGFREDWAIIPFLVLLLTGFIVSIIDFAYIQKLVFQSIWVIAGVPILLFGSAMRFLPRRRLIKAGFGSIWKTPFLQIVEDHRLVTDGYYKHIRHPVYLGEIGRALGLVITLKPVWACYYDHRVSVSSYPNRNWGEDAHWGIWWRIYRIPKKYREIDTIHLLMHMFYSPPLELSKFLSNKKMQY